MEVVVVAHYEYLLSLHLGSYQELEYLSRYFHHRHRLLQQQPIVLDAAELGIVVQRLHLQ